MTKIKIEKIKIGDRNYYKPIMENNCCNTFGNIDEIKLRKIGSVFKMCIVIYDDYSENNDYYPINFCPFCGEKIEYEIVKEQDLTDECNKLNDELKELQKQIKDTDSIKERKLLSEKAYNKKMKIFNLTRGYTID